MPERKLKTHRRRVSSIEEFRTMAHELRVAFQSEGIALNPQSGIAELIRAGEEISDTGIGDFLLGLHLERVYRAIVPLSGHSFRKQYLHKLKSGNLRFLNRVKSPARNHLFELEVWRSLNNLKAKCADLDEPDVHVKLGNSDIGIACKKIYSENGVSKALSNAVKQIDNHCPGLGMVAFSIDDLFPEGESVGAGTIDEASNFLAGVCKDFLISNEGNLKRYFRSGRIVGALAFASTIVEATRDSPKYSNMQQMYFWTTPDLGQAAKKAQDELKKLF